MMPNIQIFKVGIILTLAFNANLLAMQPINGEYIEFLAEDLRLFGNAPNNIQQENLILDGKQECCELWFQALSGSFPNIKTIAIDFGPQVSVEYAHYVLEKFNQIRSRFSDFNKLIIFHNIPLNIQSNESYCMNNLFQCMAEINHIIISHGPRPYDGPYSLNASNENRYKTSRVLYSLPRATMQRKQPKQSTRKISQKAVATPDYLSIAHQKWLIETEKLISFCFVLNRDNSALFLQIPQLTAEGQVLSGEEKNKLYNILTLACVIRAREDADITNTYEDLLTAFNVLNWESDVAYPLQQ